MDVQRRRYANVHLLASYSEKNFLKYGVICDCILLGKQMLFFLGYTNNGAFRHTFRGWPAFMKISFNHSDFDRLSWYHELACDNAVRTGKLY